MSSPDVIPSRDEIISLAMKQGSLKPFPANALKLIEISKDPNVPTDQILELVEREPAIAARILAVANSPLYGYSRQIDSISQAIIIVGIRHITQLAISFSTDTLYSDSCTDPEYTQHFQRLYTHSLGCAVLARELTAHQDVVNGTEAFLHGLLHNIGKLIFCTVVPDYFRKLDGLAANENIIALEEKHFGISHEEIGSLCARQWGFPEEIVCTIARHHGSPDEPLDCPTAQLIEAADWISVTQGVGLPVAENTDESANDAGHWNPFIENMDLESQVQVAESARDEVAHLTSSG